MELVGGGIFSVSPDPGEEIGIMIEVPRELMRVSLVEVFLQLVVPWKRLVAIKGVAPLILMSRKGDTYRDLSADG